ncbi:hypothetical protein KDX16_16195 [Burkholderia vietnamiensis]|uniref:Uncharacterized protein n=1 Tax=Burkholderia aenigmatica TaxID=2015348 RepID=A0A6P2TAF3_9BURK|nr:MULTISPECIES: hypothetical protein [Burkholderia cepacia complex]HDR9756628.1 hypothetical protein [Burkholderia cepacia ATCC 25416]MBR7917366.1 hypothetical protein [Burkholderia vietnamiensis]MBR8054326.1 hypothetical protein [Burkholderia vietnamiensis]VWC52648.1 hypothetical protein BLA13014_08016 [Burkholderia aenigmatica]HDR9789622.1 hypothetical protein [Burkholderia cepacia ATCC 25416]
MPQQPDPHACRICGQQLDQPGKPDTGDCGGDCVRCMADYRDPDALETMRKVEPDNPQWKPAKGHWPGHQIAVDCDPDLQEVARLTTMMRDVFDRVLSASNIAKTRGTCAYGAILLRNSLEQFGKCAATVRGGDGDLGEGAIDQPGMWNGHYWVEGKTPAGVGFVADITADQFGWSKAVVLPIDQAGERYRAGDDEIVAEAVAELEAQITAEARMAIRCLDD